RKRDLFAGASGHDHGFGDELRCPASRIEVAQHTKHPAVWKAGLIAKNSVGSEHRMFVDEISEILAHDKHVEELLVHDLEFLHLLAGLRIADPEGELHRIAGMKRARLYLQVHRILDRVGDSEHQLHAATRTSAGLGRANIYI